MSADGVPSHDDRLQGAGDRAFRVLVLFLTFDPEKTKGVRAVLGDFFKAREGIEFTVVEIDNANEQREWQSASTEGWPCRAFAVGGDNTAHEFTGWDRGWREVRARLPETFDVVLMVNDALANSKPLEALEAIDADIIRQLPAQKTVLGWVDTFSRVNPDPLDTLAQPMRIGGQACRKWLCTTFFMVPRSVFEKLYPVTSFSTANEVFTRYCPEKPFRESAPLSQNYQEFLYTHQTKVWRRGDKRGYVLSETTFPLFKNKVRNILNEHALSIKLWKLGVGHVNLATFDRPSRGLGIKHDQVKGSAGTRLRKLRLLSWRQFFHEVIPPLLKRRGLRSS
ncbi:hypothetical protein [Hyphomonas sp. UBA4494]|jgi:hypothetical protein|uniref:hypothetical protein n=1 Tax=Hyphomonas sp. UBA4494 TaxID=1946631 RepID=UPI0025B93FBE|nr:hypothetical protein [Hyphomonas sp. UBA4494]